MISRVVQPVTHHQTNPEMQICVCIYRYIPSKVILFFEKTLLVHFLTVYLFLYICFWRPS